MHCVLTWSQMFPTRHPQVSCRNLQDREVSQLHMKKTLLTLSVNICARSDRRRFTLLSTAHKSTLVSNSTHCQQSAVNTTEQKTPKSGGKLRAVGLINRSEDKFTFQPHSRIWGDSRCLFSLFSCPLLRQVLRTTLDRKPTSGTSYIFVYLHHYWHQAEYHPFTSGSHMASTIGDNEDWIHPFNKEQIKDVKSKVEWI